MMGDEKRYQVIGHCALITQDHGPLGKMRQTLLRGAIIGPGMTDAERDHNLAGGLIAEIPADEPAGLDAAGVPVVGTERLVGDGEPGSPATLEPGPTPPAQGDAADAARDKAREAAKAKLPADGTAPDGRAAKDVWVEYAVVKGMDRGEAEKADKAELIAALKP
jgi:hypothetical protein